MENQAQHQANVSQRLGDIADQLTEVARGLQSVTGYGKKTRRLTWLAFISFGLDILLTLAFAFALSASQVNACHASNDARAGQVIIWNTIVHQFSQPHPSAHQQLQQERFLRFVDHNFAPLQCRAFYLP